MTAVPKGSAGPRPLSWGELLAAGVSLCWAQPGPLLAAAAVAAGATAAAAAVPDPTGALGWLAGTLAGTALAAVTTAAVLETVAGRRTGVRGCLAVLRPRLATVTGLGLAVSLAVTLGSTLLVLPGLFVWAVCGLAVPAAVTEGTPLIGSLRRSWRLTVPDLVRVSALRATAVGLAAAVSGGARLMVQLQVGEPWAGPAGGVVVRSVAAVVAVYPPAVQALLYVDRRVRAERLDPADGLDRWPAGRRGG